MYRTRHMVLNDEQQRHATWCWFFLVDAYHILAGRIVRGEPLTGEKKRPMCSKTRRYVRELWGTVPCIYCGRELKGLEITMEHVLPRSLGGRNHRDNIRPACKKCNELRGQMFNMLTGLARRHGQKFVYLYHPDKRLNVTVDPYRYK